jgi:hypothetical protein
MPPTKKEKNNALKRILTFHSFLLFLNFLLYSLLAYIWVENDHIKDTTSKVLGSIAGIWALICFLALIIKGSQFNLFDRSIDRYRESLKKKKIRFSANAILIASFLFLSYCIIYSRTTVFKSMQVQ